MLYEDRLNGIISVEKYKTKQVEIQNELKGIEEQIEKLGKYNIKYKEEGSQILELLSGFKTIYLKQDLGGKAKILSAILERCEIMGTKSKNHTGSVIDERSTTFIWKPPFDTLFRMGQLAKEYNQVRKNELRGGRIYEFRTFLRHNSIAYQIQFLQSIAWPFSPASHFLASLTNGE